MKSDILLPKHKRTKEQLLRLQKLPLAQKIALSERRLTRFYEETGGKVSVSFSGGKDSTVLLHLVRKLYPDVVAVFSDTGLEYPEIRDFVKTIKNVVWVKPKKQFKDVIKDYGYPVVSKKVAKQIDICRRLPNGAAANLYRTGYTKDGNYSERWKLSKKWEHLLDAPFKISEKCCNALKKEPLKTFEKESGLYPIIGTMASEGGTREKSWYAHGCNIFGKSPRSAPLSFWTDADIWEYIRLNNLPYSNIYDMGEKRTGCMFCMFGCAMGDELGRFERMKISHPAQYKYCMENLGMREVIKYTFGVDMDAQNELF